MDTKKLKTLQTEYFKISALHKTILDIKELAGSKILKENNFTEQETGEKISDPFHSYLMSDTDFNKYLELVTKEQLKKGITDEIMIKNEKNLMNIETQLLKMAYLTIPKHLNNNLTMQQFIDGCRMSVKTYKEAIYLITHLQTN